MATERYIEAIGRRKTASARVRITPAKETTIVVNDKPILEYFGNLAHQLDVQSVLGVEEAGVVLRSDMFEHPNRGDAIEGPGDRAVVELFDRDR